MNGTVPICSNILDNVQSCCQLRSADDIPDQLIHSLDFASFPLDPELGCNLPIYGITFDILYVLVLGLRVSQM